MTPPFLAPSRPSSFRRRVRAAARAALVSVSLLGAATLLGCAPEDPMSMPDRFDQFMIPQLSEQVRGWQSWPRVEVGFPEQVDAGRHNWSNFTDASAIVGLELFGDTLRLVAQVMDDRPLIQPYERLRHPEWWGIPVAGDAIELRLRPTDLTRDPFEAIIQLGSEGLAPEFIVTRTPRGPLGRVDDAIIQVQRVTGGYEVFVQVVETNRFGLVPFYTSGYEITVTLHDLDGDPSTYSRLSGKTQTRP